MDHENPVRWVGVLLKLDFTEELTQATYFLTFNEPTAVLSEY